jgi:hypothetical protein
MSAKCDQVRRQFVADPNDLLKAKAVDLAQVRWSLRAVQDEHRLSACTHDMNVCRTVIG